MKHVRVNVRSTMNTAMVRHEKRNGRDVVIVPSATLPDDIVMNTIMYPADEIEGSYRGLERTPAPLGHPTINGKFVSARDPEGINLGWIGAWNENVRREGGRVKLDKVIDVEFANRSEGGKAVLNAIEKGEPVHTSTGLYCNLEAANGDVSHKSIARNIEFDHDAILLDEEGAATPVQGVGMMVNSKGEPQEIEVINSAIEDDTERELGWAVDQAVRALEKRRKAPLYERAMKALTEAILGSEREPSEQQNKDADMTVSKEQFDALSAKVDALSEAVPNAEAITNAVTAAVKPLTDQLAANADAQKAKDDAERADLVDKVVKANLLDEETATELTLNALRKLGEKVKPGKAAALNAGGFKPGADDEFADVDLNANLEVK